MLAALGLSAWAQVGDGPLPPMTAPPTIYSSTPPSTAVGVPRMALRPPSFSAGAAPALAASRVTADGREERNFLRNAAAQSRFELDASRLAFTKSGNGTIRALAASLINHHTTVGLELAHLLNSRGMAMPMLADPQRKTLKLLAKAGGSKFDTLYMQQVGLAQAAVARDYEKASAVLREPQVNAWIVKTLGTTRYHQNMVERASPADPQSARLNRATRPQVKAMATGVEPIAATGVARINGSNSR